MLCLCGMFLETGARMNDGSLQAACALIADVEYHFVEKLASATDGGEVVVC